MVVAVSDPEQLVVKVRATSGDAPGYARAAALRPDSAGNMIGYRRQYRPARRALRHAWMRLEAPSSSRWMTARINSGEEQRDVADDGLGGLRRVRGSRGPRAGPSSREAAKRPRRQSET